LKNIFITGCGDGLGKTLLETSEECGYNVFPHFRENKNFISGDINKKNILEKLPKFLKMNSIDVFINNAAIYKKKSLVDTTDDEIENIINTNLLSQILITKRVYSFFKERGSGLIININSLSGKISSANESIYCASKSGLYSFSKSLQLESIDSNIEIVDLFPGAMKTKMTRDRTNYNTLIDTKDVSKVVFDIIFKHTNLYMNEIVIRKKNKKVEIDSNGIID
jgi:short-subunit dehydrogenase